MTGKVLITGGAGFIGLHLANHLLNYGYDVSMVDNYLRGVNDIELKRTLDRKGATFVEIDLRDIEAVLKLGTDFNIIIHLAAIIGVANVLANPYKVLHDNVQLLENAIKLARGQKNMRRLLFSSTSEVYAGTLKTFGMRIPTEEVTPLTVTGLDQPRTSYMLSKIYGEALCQQASLPFTIFRPHNIYGPRMGMSHVIPEQLKKAHFSKDGEKIEVFSTEHSRSFCFVEDAVNMLHRMMEAVACEGETLNVGTQGPELTMRQVSIACCKAAGKELVIDAKGATDGSPVRRAPEMSLTSKLTGCDSVVELEEGLARTYDWYRANIFEKSTISKT